MVLPYQVPQTGRLQQQEVTASQSWRLEVWDEGVGRAASLRGLGGKDLLRPLSFLVDGRLLPVSSCCLPSVCPSHSFL